MTELTVDAILSRLCENVPAGFVQNAANPAYLFLQQLAINIQKLKIDLQNEINRNSVLHATGSDLDSVGRNFFGFVRKPNESDNVYRQRCLSVLSVRTGRTNQYYAELASSVAGVSAVFVDYNSRYKKIMISYISDADLLSDLQAAFSEPSQIGDEFSFIRMRPLNYSVSVVIKNYVLSSSDQTEIKTLVTDYCSDNFDINSDYLLSLIYSRLSADAAVKIDMHNFVKKDFKAYPLFKRVDLSNV